MDLPLKIDEEMFLLSGFHPRQVKAYRNYWNRYSSRQKYWNSNTIRRDLQWE